MFEFLKNLGNNNAGAEIPAVNVIKQQAVNDVLNSYLTGIQNKEIPNTTDLVNRIGSDAVMQGVKQGLNFGNNDVAQWESQYANGAEGRNSGYRIPQTPEDIMLAKQNNFNIPQATAEQSSLSGGIKEERPEIIARKSGWDNLLSGLKDLGAGFKENATQGFKVDNLGKRIDPTAYKQSINPDDYNTQLSPEDETKYQDWYKNNQTQGFINPNDSGQDYDFRGAYKAGYQPTEQGGHWVDTYKKPNHATFSNESEYATGENAKYAGKWKGDQFIAPRNENKMTKAGEILGTLGKFAASPTGRGLIVGGLVGATGGSPLQAMAYGGSATMQNQQSKMNDSLYRGQLKQLGYSDEDLNSLGGYVGKDAYKAVSDGAYKLQYGNYRDRKLDQDSYIKLKKYYDDQQRQGILDPASYKLAVKDLNDRFINDNIATANVGNIQASNDTRKTDSTIDLNGKRGKYLDVMSAEQPKRTGIMQENATSNRIRANKTGSGRGGSGYQAGTKGNGKKNPMYGSHLSEYNQILATGDKNKINYARNNFIKVYGEDPDKAIKSDNDILRFLEE